MFVYVLWFWKFYYIHLAYNFSKQWRHGYHCFVIFRSTSPWKPVKTILVAIKPRFHLDCCIYPSLIPWNWNWNSLGKWFKWSFMNSTEEIRPGNPNFPYLPVTEFNCFEPGLFGSKRDRKTTLMSLDMIRKNWSSIPRYLTIFIHISRPENYNTWKDLQMTTYDPFLKPIHPRIIYVGTMMKNYTMHSTKHAHINQGYIHEYIQWINWGQTKVVFLPRDPHI